MILYLLFFTLSILFTLSFYITNRDILAPPSIVCIMFIISTLCTIYNVEMWNVNISIETCATIIIGVLTFIIGYSIANFLFSKVKSNNTREAKLSSQTQFAEINIENYKIIIISIFCVWVIMIYFHEVVRVATAYGYSGGWSELIKAYRAASAYDTSTDIESLSIYAKIGYKVVTAVAYVFLYIIINNLVINRRICIKYFPSIILFTVCTFITGGRLPVLKLVSAGVIMYGVIWHSYNGWNNKLGFKFIKKCFIIFILVCIGFVAVKNVVGRTNKFDPLYYFTSYAGGSIELLDLFVKNPTGSSNIWGKETFYALNSTIGKFLNIDVLSYIPHKEFRYSTNGMSVGNVYTAFRAYIYDFGYGGMIILVVFCSMFYTIFYEKLRYLKKSGPININILFYAYISCGFFLMSIDDIFYSTIIGINTMIFLVLFKLIIWFLIKFKVKFK